MDLGVDDVGDGRWMTHMELAQAREISTASAIKLALRHGWRKQKDNRGTLRCYVPAEFVAPKKDTRAVMAGGAEASAAIAALQSAVTMLGDQLTHERTRADGLRERVDDLTGRLANAKAELAAAREPADRHHASAQEAVREIGRAAETEADLRRELGAAQMALSEAQADAAELRQAEEVRKGRGLVARLRSAWTGT